MAKKIVGIISFMNDAGAQQALMRLMDQFRKRGYETEVWFLYRRAACFEEAGGVHVLLDKGIVSPLGFARLWMRLVARLRDDKPDAVIGFLPLGNAVGLSAAALCGIRLRIASQRSPGTTYGLAMRSLDRVLGTAGVYHRIVCVSRAVADSFSTYPESYRSRLCVVNNGIDWTASRLGKQEARASFGLPADLPVLVATGRFAIQKNYDLMVRVVATTPRVRLAIAGDGKLRGAAEKVAHELCADGRIHFLGNIPPARIPDLLRAADGFIQTSLFEGQSNSTLEAMHEGLPIICSDIDMQRETVSEEDTEPAALLVPLDDFDAWRNAIIRIRDDPGFGWELGARAKALVSRRFSLNRMVDGFEHTLTEPEEQEWHISGDEHSAERADYIR